MATGKNIISQTSTQHLVYWKEFKRRTNLLTMREGASTHSFIEDRHKKHVAVFEIRFHFVNGLNPERKRSFHTHIIILSMISCFLFFEVNY